AAAAGAGGGGGRPPPRTRFLGGGFAEGPPPPLGPGGGARGGPTAGGGGGAAPPATPGALPARSRAGENLEADPPLGHRPIPLRLVGVVEENPLVRGHGDPVAALDLALELPRSPAREAHAEVAAARPLPGGDRAQGVRL